MYLLTIPYILNCKLQFGCCSFLIYSKQDDANQLVQNIEVQMDERDRPQNGLHIN